MIFTLVCQLRISVKRSIKVPLTVQFAAMMENAETRLVLFSAQYSLLPPYCVAMF